MIAMKSDSEMMTSFMFKLGLESYDGQDIFFTECGHAIVVNGWIPDKIICVPQFQQ